jgi:DNA-directed RNA polymerase specialized sigma24 family protein
MFRSVFFIATLIALNGITAGYSQYEGMFHRPYYQKAGINKKFYDDVLAIQNKDSAFKITEKIRKKAIEEKDIEVELDTRLLEIFYNCLYELETEEVLVNELLKVSRAGLKHHLLILQARAIRIIVWYYWYKVGNYEMASDYILELDEILQKIPDAEFPDKAECLVSIGYCYHFFGDYRKAMDYFYKASRIAEIPFNAMAVNSAVNGLGLCYKELGILDSSDLCFRKILANTKNIFYHQWEGIASGNIAYNHYLRGEFKEAIPLFIIDKNRALEYSDFALAAGAAIPLADIYIGQNKLDAAWKEIEDAHKFIVVSDQPDRLRQLFPVMSKWYGKKGNTELSARYLDSTVIAMKKYYEKSNSLQLLRASQRSEIEKNKAAINKLQREKDRKIFSRNLIILSLAFIFLLIGIFIQHRYKQIKQQQQIQTLKIQEAEAELALAKNQLEEFLRRVSEKNELIEKLEEQSRLIENNELLIELKQSAILTEDDWLNFKLNYERVYPQFFNRLNDKFPGLSPSETRYITLAKLGFSSNEIARSLGISKKSVHVTWHRIRKKLHLPETKTVQEMVSEVR